MSHPRTDRIADLAAQLQALDPPAVRLARSLYERARADLALLIHRRAPLDVVEAHRYRVDRAHEALVAAWRSVTGSPAAV